MENMFFAHAANKRFTKKQSYALFVNFVLWYGLKEKLMNRGVRRASKEEVRTVEYTFGVYKSLIVAVYKPSEWFVCKEAKDRLPRQDIVLTPKPENRLFFVDERYEQGFPLDDNESFYIGKSIARLKLNQSAQNSITYPIHWRKIQFIFNEIDKSEFGDWINLVFVVKTFILGRCYGK